MSSIFTKIINKELPSYKIYETEKIFAFLALDQINLGHTLVVPKNEVDHFFQMSNEEYNEVFRVSKFLSETIKEISQARRVAMAVQGFEVPHAHVHLIPVNSPEEFSFALGKKREGSVMKEVQEKILNKLEERGLL